MMIASYKFEHSAKEIRLMEKSSIFSRFGAKYHLDFTIFLWYSDPDCMKPVGTCCRISGSTYVATHLQPSLNSKNLSLFALKREFLFLSLSFFGNLNNPRSLDPLLKLKIIIASCSEK